MPSVHCHSLPIMNSNATTNDDNWNAVLNRDATLKGTFYICIKTTGIYCNPGCPARTPLRANVTFLPTPSEAQSAGFRPCKRCKPPT
jgi:methylphosphotriester-DNA--protein-cysteine methyltransferase